MSVADVLLPLLAGGVSATSPAAAHGVMTAIDAAQAMAAQRRQRDLVNMAQTERARVGSFLANLPDDPDAPENAAARDLASAGDVETATQLYKAGQERKAGLVSRNLQNAEANRQLGDLQSAIQAATAPPEGLEAGPPAPAPIVNAIKAGRVANALAPFNPLAAAEMGLSGSSPARSEAKAPHLEHRVGAQGEGLYSWNPSTGGWVFDSPAAPEKERRSLQYRTDPGTGQVFKQTIVNGEVVKEEPWGKPKADRVEDPVRELNEAAAAYDRIAKELARSQARDSADWQANPARPGWVSRTLHPEADKAPMSPRTADLQAQLGALDQRQRVLQARLSGGAVEGSAGVAGTAWPSAAPGVGAVPGSPPAPPARIEPGRTATLPDGTKVRWDGTSWQPAKK